MLYNYISLVFFLSLSTGLVTALSSESLEDMPVEQETELVVNSFNAVQEDQGALDELEMEDLFAPLEDDGLPLPDFTPPSQLTIFVREYGILALDYSIIAFHKCCDLKKWITAQCCKKLLALKHIGFKK